MNILEFLRALTVLQTVRESELPQSLVEFLLAFGYLVPSPDLPGCLQRQREMEQLEGLQQAYFGWLTRDQPIPAVRPVEPPLWASVSVPEPPGMSGRYHGAIVHVPVEYQVDGRSPCPLEQHLDESPDGTSVRYCCGSEGPFVLWVSYQGQACVVVRSVPTTRSAMISRG